jgi:hypothetical protein
MVVVVASDISSARGVESRVLLVTEGRAVVEILD